MKRYHFANKALLAMGLLLTLGTSSVYADNVISFDTSGTSSGYAVSATALFDINPTAYTMTITLTNGNTTNATVAALLDGFNFTTTGGSGLSLVSVSAAGFMDCTSGTCVSVNTFVDQKTNTTLTSPYTWGLSGSAGSGYILDAGSGQLHPAGIINSALLNASSNNGSSPHNDLLTGPVVFTFDFTTAPTNITSTTFVWGTMPTTTQGVNTTVTVPDGGMTLMLLGGALVGIETLRRRLRA